jgi:hypothetical protein
MNEANNVSSEQGYCSLSQVQQMQVKALLDDIDNDVIILEWKCVYVRQQNALRQPLEGLDPSEVRNADELQGKRCLIFPVLKLKAVMEVSRTPVFLLFAFFCLSFSVFFCLHVSLMGHRVYDTV